MIKRFAIVCTFVIILIGLSGCTKTATDEMALEFAPRAFDYVQTQQGSDIEIERVNWKCILAMELCTYVIEAVDTETESIIYYLVDVDNSTLHESGKPIDQEYFEAFADQHLYQGKATDRQIRRALNNMD